jgi:hypothetical protein
VYTTEHNFSFKTIDHLQDGLRNCFPDSELLKQISVKRTKAMAITTNVIGAHEKEFIVNALKSENIKFSLLIDQSTDSGTKKCCCVVVWYFDQKLGKISSKFYELIDICKDGNNTCTAEHLFQLVTNSLTVKNITLDNLIGFGADGCNTMMGEFNSFASRLQSSCPGIKISKCISQSQHLCAS